MTEIPKTIDEAWGAFNSRVFNHGKDETAYNSFRAALSCLFASDLHVGSMPCESFAKRPSPVDRGTVPCECTKIAQDETCPIGYPSLLCEVCEGMGHVPAVKLDGSELWEIVFGIADDAAAEITDEQYQQIADAINKVFIDPVSSSSTHKKVATDTDLLDALASNSWDLRCVSVPTGGDDYDIDWLVIEHHQAHPHERTIAQAYRDDPREAIRRAMRETDPKAERCVPCASVLHEGDSVYYEHGEGGHIHSWCAGDDAKSFVDEDEMPLKDGDPLPEPFAYKLEA